MALSQADRIAISLKIVKIPDEDARADANIASLEVLKTDAQAQDDSNAALMSTSDTLINLYQGEIERYDGNGRTQLVEQDLINSSNKLFQNFFFPNDPQTALPNIPDGVWKNFQAFSGSAAVGKNYTEGYAAITGEDSLIADINSKITTVESFGAVARSTGQKCTGGAPDVIDNDVAMQSAATNLKNSVQTWETFINITYSLVPTSIQDPDPTRVVENDASRQDITDTVADIDTWQALPDFDTSHGEVTCAGFNSIDVNTLNATKFRSGELQDLKDAIAARQAFLTTRQAQINGYLGGVTQDFNTGDIISATGWYGYRFRFIDMRLNIMNGSLNTLNSIQVGQNAQEQAKNSNANSLIAYSGIIVASRFRSPGGNNNTIHVLDASGFSISDSVFVKAEKQQELSGSILGIDGNRITLDFTVPQKYRETEYARIYKDIS